MSEDMSGDMSERLSEDMSERVSKLYNPILINRPQPPKNTKKPKPEQPMQQKNPNNRPQKHKNTKPEQPHQKNKTT